jgi:hypothetical protein
MRSHRHHIPKAQGSPVNIPLCFSTIQTIIDYVSSAPGQDVAEVINHFELLRADIDNKLQALEKSSDKTGKMGQSGTS